MYLKVYLKDRGIKNCEVCIKAGIGEATLSEFLNGKRKLNFKTACKIADALDLTIDQFRNLTTEEGGNLLDNYNNN